MRCPRLGTTQQAERLLGSPLRRHGGLQGESGALPGGSSLSGCIHPPAPPQAESSAVAGSGRGGRGRRAAPSPAQGGGACCALRGRLVSADSSGEAVLSHGVLGQSGRVGGQGAPRER